MKKPRILILGYGNPGRQDDGIGPAMATAIEKWVLPGVTVEVDYQLNIEHAAELAQHDIVLFVDADRDAPAPYVLKKIVSTEAESGKPDVREIAFTSHSVSPKSVLAICDEHLGAAPEAWILGIRGYAYEFGEELTPQAQKNLEQALAYVQTLIDTWNQRRLTSPE